MFCLELNSQSQERPKYQFIFTDLRQISEHRSRLKHTVCCHCGVGPWTNHHLLGISTLTLFFWQVSQRDHALHSDKTQSTGWTTTCPPTARAWRTEGSSSPAAAMLTLLWQGDDEAEMNTNRHRGVIQLWQTEGCCYLLIEIWNTLHLKPLEKSIFLSSGVVMMYLKALLRHVLSQITSKLVKIHQNLVLSRWIKVLPQQQWAQRKVQQAELHAECTHSYPPRSKHGGLCVMSDCEQLDDTARLSMQTVPDQYLPGYELTQRYGAEYTTLQSTRSHRSDTELPFVMKLFVIYCWLGKREKTTAF